MAENEKSGIERRKHERILIQGDAFAVIQPGSDRLLVPILDISLGGLSFRSAEKLDWRDEIIRLDLLILEKEFCLQGLAMRRIADIEIFQSLPAEIQLRKQSLQFEILSASQIAWLEHLIRQFRRQPYSGPERRQAQTDRRSGLDRRSEGF